MSVRGTTEAEVVALLPVQEVVSALVTGPRPVRDLVPVEPSSTQPLVGEQVLVRLVIVVGMTRAIVRRYRDMRAGARPVAINADGRFDRARQAALLLDALDRLA